MIFLLATSAVATLPAQQADLAPLRNKPEKTVVHPVYHNTMMVVKFRHDSGVHLENGEFAHVDGTEINAILQEVSVQISRHIQLPQAQLDAWRRSGEKLSGLRLHDLNLFFRVELSDRNLMGETCDRLNAFDVVEIAYPLPQGGDPEMPARVPFRHPSLAPKDALASAFDFSTQQGYRGEAPDGIDADYGETFSGSRGEGHLIADVETGWTDDHLDIAHKSLGAFTGLTPAPYPWDHGTAVLGELVGEDNGMGVKGIVHQADVILSSHLGLSANIPTAIAFGATAVGAGDVLVLEVQCYGAVPGPFPCEYDPATFATIQTATANGTHVFSAAGNGGHNLDLPVYGGAFDRSVRDSGAVMCGQSTGAPLDPNTFSNYGSRLDAHGWGANVVSAGYGDLFGAGTPTQEFTSAFSGTSSATPIVTGAGVMLNGIYREAFGSALTPLALRSLIAATGTAQNPGHRIGPRPNMRTALEMLGVPILSVSGNLVPGGNVDLDLKAQAGDTYSLFFSRSLAATPTHNAPIGYLFLGPVSNTVPGVIPGGGVETLSFSIPNNPAFSGTILGYVQVEITFASGPGTGAYTNYVPIAIQ
ncbi:MAG: S8 family serine peptidase [Planctomycetota bacterium]